MSEPWWFCGNCALEYDEPYCSACGRMLVNEETNGGTDAPPREDPSRANQEVTDG